MSKSDLESQLLLCKDRTMDGWEVHTKYIDQNIAVCSFSPSRNLSHNRRMNVVSGGCSSGLLGFSYQKQHTMFQKEQHGIFNNKTQIQNVTQIVTGITKQAGKAFYCFIVIRLILSGTHKLS